MTAGCGHLTRAGLGLAVMGVALLVACGGGGQQKSPTPATAAPVTASATAPPSSATSVAATATRTAVPATFTATATATATAASTLPLFVPPAQTVERDPASSVTVPIVIDDVRVGRNEGFDRIVFELTAEGYGYSARYVPTASTCGAGNPVSASGGAQFVVTLRSAAAHDDAGNATLTSTQIDTPGNPAIRQALSICDFEGIVSWLVGVDAQRPFRVFTLTGPPRLVVDFDTR